MQKTLSVVNLSAIRRNALYVRGLLKDKFFFAVVKADAYGHGAPEVASAIEDIADGFCVAITDEGAALRLSGITKPILVFTPPLGEDDILRAEYYGLTVTVNSAETAARIKGLDCHIKINTGMNRYGCTLSELKDILKILGPRQITGVYTHAYDPCDRAAMLAQLKIFGEAERLVKAVDPYAVAHFASSGGILAGSEFIKDGARSGILLYGYAPAGFKAETEPALKVYARLAQRTEFVGGGIGYGAATKNYSRLSTYRLGYADGFFRDSGLGEGNLCMDAFIKDCGDRNAKNATHVSKTDNENATHVSKTNAEKTDGSGGDMFGGMLLPVFTNAEEYAAENGTIAYEALCSVTRRSERIYEQD